MRVALRFLPAGMAMATATGTFVSAAGCGPPKLFLGTFAEAESEVSDSGDGPDPLAPEWPDAGRDSSACGSGAAVDAAASEVMLSAFESAACRSCAMSACCSETIACFGNPTDASFACTRYAECIDRCRVEANAGTDASPTDASIVSSHCEAECSSLGRPEEYSQLEVCLVTACTCPGF